MDWIKRITVTRECMECGRIFDMDYSADRIEWAHGHDCKEDW